MLKNNNKVKSNISKGERNLINISLGKKKPKNEKDHKLLNEINRIKKNGGTIIIPHD
jgi:hypothetical protein